MGFPNRLRIDEIFKDLKRESRINIEYETVASSASEFHANILSVNGCNTVKEFSEKQRNNCEKIIDIFFEEITSLPDSEISSLAIEFCDRFQYFKNVTKPATYQSIDDSFRFNYFVNAQIHCVNPNLVHSKNDIVHLAAWRFAHHWSDIIDNSINSIEFFIQVNIPANKFIKYSTPSQSNPIVAKNAYSLKKLAKDSSCLTDLLNSLKKNGFVARETELKEFKKIFFNTKPKQPIIWLTTISDLAYLIKYIYRELNAIDRPLKIWQVTASLFVDSKGDPFPSTKFKGQKRPAQAELLKKIADHLK